MASIATAEEKHLEPLWATSVERTERIDGRPSDFLDPHRAALEENPDRAERPSARTILAVMIVAATASSVTNVIAGSTFLGFGGGMIFVAAAGVSEILPNKWRPFGIPSVLIATSVNAHTALGWRWCYYWGLISCVVSSVGILIFYFPPPRPQYDIEKTRWQEFKDIDFVGVSLYSSGLTTFLIGLTWAGGAGHPWRSASVIIPVVLGFTVLLSAFVYDFVWAKQPLFPLKIFKKFREYTVLLGITFVAGLALGLIGTFRSMGGSVGNAIFNTILNNIVNDNLGSAIAKAAHSTGQYDPANISHLIGATIKNAAGVPGAFATVPGITPAVEAASIQALRDVYAKGFRMISYCTIPFNVIAIILALTMFDPSEYLTNHTAVRLETEHKNRKDVSKSNS
ncbi:hypothetical protein yc1106_00009 [Curvularia clavata]|uniref:Major facilitator superfamily (MFS) profile domain-containing protein n=1 Tax=Curvularia clavata TaxID=95742 RepID=A0A9Q8YZM9_CURCL|nr:hypothetical protein yc1106_00009 [Curvularia clavata]